MQNDKPSLSRTRQQDTQFRVMRVISANLKIAQRKLAAQMGASLGLAHYFLSSLIKLGWVKIDHFRTSSNKKQYAYILTPTGIAQKAAIAARFLKRKTEKYEALKKEIEFIREEMEGIDGHHIAR